MNFEGALAIVHLLIYRGIGREEAITIPAVPAAFRERIRGYLESHSPVSADNGAPVRCQNDWLQQHDRWSWRNWRRLRQRLLDEGTWSATEIRSLDDVTDRLLTKIGPPSSSAEADVSDLSLGRAGIGGVDCTTFIALIAKAADVGFRAFVVLRSAGHEDIQLLLKPQF